MFVWMFSDCLPVNHANVVIIITLICCTDCLPGFVWRWGYRMCTRPSYCLDIFVWFMTFHFLLRCLFTICTWFSCCCRCLFPARIFLHILIVMFSSNLTSLTLPYSYHLLLTTAHSHFFPWPAAEEGSGLEQRFRAEVRGSHCWIWIMFFGQEMKNDNNLCMLHLSFMLYLKFTLNNSNITKFVCRLQELLLAFYTSIWVWRCWYQVVCNFYGRREDTWKSFVESTYNCAFDSGAANERYFNCNFRKRLKVLEFSFLVAANLVNVVHETFRTAFKLKSQEFNGVKEV